MIGKIFLVIVGCFFLIESLYSDNPLDKECGAINQSVVIWPYDLNKKLSVIKGGVQPFYVALFNKGLTSYDSAELEFSIPEGWQIWLGAEAPPDKKYFRKSAIYSINKLVDKKIDKGNYQISEACGTVIIIIRAMENAKDTDIMKICWKKDGQLLSEIEYTLSLLNLNTSALSDIKSKPMIGMWVNDPKFHRDTMSEFYRTLKLVGVDYVIIPLELYIKSSDMLKDLSLKVYINQWWPYDYYVPGDVPEDAFSILSDGTVDKKRWSPTYMSEGGDAFIGEIKNITNKLNSLASVYALMLDYEPTSKGIDADYSMKSKRAFEKYLRQNIENWPEDVLENGKFEEEWIDFRCQQSLDYVAWFGREIKKNLPELKLAVSSSGATGKRNDENRRKAVTDISKLGDVCNEIHPQLYSYGKNGLVFKKFIDKKNLGDSTMKRSLAPVYPAVACGDKNSVSSVKSEYLRAQLLYWWFCHENMHGFEIWQYFYGVDGNYMMMINELYSLFTEARKMNMKKNIAFDRILLSTPDDRLIVNACISENKKTAWVVFFNFTNATINLQITPNDNWKLYSEITKKSEPLSANIVKYEINK